MNVAIVLVLHLALLSNACARTIGHGQVLPFAQPNPVTISEKAAVKFKPQLYIDYGCVSFPAVNAAGEITGGLKGTDGTDGGSRVYGRSTWYQDKWKRPRPPRLGVYGVVA
ncbi:hypothetical protein JG688_00014031 [Phytophthora aleatoria]|uniref:Uncharacterized protein n=1 Tax=Phytophthora aleatoria TaxID=2496075 RepID=A0A8J5J0Z8_9STRA|nr:hypothetical protein JG688_00014031 [Phytophthora aleatoria]